MLSKKQTQAIIDRIAPLIIDKLDIKHIAITWHLVHHRSKFKRIKHNKDFSAVSYINNGRADIIVYYSNIVDKKDLVATIFHELFHVRLGELEKLARRDKVKNRNRKSLKEDECCVSALEDLIMYCLYNHRKFKA